jgi:anti-anti-sigma regulatory factor
MSEGPGQRRGPSSSARCSTERASTGIVIVDMHDETLINSSGLGVLARLAAAGVNIEIRGARGVVRRALEISGLDKVPNVRVW